MRYYIEVPRNLGKAKQLEEIYNADLLPSKPEWSSVPESKAVVVVVNNGFFEAASLRILRAGVERVCRPRRPSTKTIPANGQRTCPKAYPLPSCILCDCVASNLAGGKDMTFPYFRIAFALFALGTLLGYLQVVALIH